MKDRREELKNDLLSISQEILKIEGEKKIAMGEFRELLKPLKERRDEVLLRIAEIDQTT